MDAFLLALCAGAALLIAYVTYGRWVAGRVFLLREDTPTPAAVFCDNSDYCPTSKSVVFGHHFTSIAGTGPIVGPAIAVMWGWLPAILWVVFGSIFIGAVHDLGSLVVSLRNKGRSVGDIAGDLLGPRVRFIFLGVLVMALWIVLAIFGLVVASVLRQYPGAIFPVLVQIPLAVAIGVTIHRKGRSIVLPSIIALALMYASVVWGDWGPLHTFNETLAAQPMWMWVVGLLLYAYVASVLPVWTLLQPRDYINALQLLSALGLLVAGLAVAATMGGAPDEREGPPRAVWLDQAGADGSTPPPMAEVGSATGVRAAAPAEAGVGASRPELELVAPVVNWQPQGAPPLMPVLFITIACGAVSGFHCLVGSGTTSKQLRRETDARAVGYGSMLTEAFLATLVIVACAAGIGLGITRTLEHRSAISLDASWIYSEGYLFSLPGDDPRTHRSIKSFELWNRAVDTETQRFAHRFNRSGVMLFQHYGDNAPVVQWGEAELLLGSEQSRAMGGETLTLPDGAIRFLQPRSGLAVNSLDEARDAIVEVELTGRLAWNKQYESWSAAGSLSATVGAFVEGAANLIKSMGVPGSVGVALMGVLVASFAGTTMDTACRLQRYVIQELSGAFLPRPPIPCCERCGYDLRGTPNGDQARGTHDTDDATHGATTCPECGAVNQWGFELVDRTDACAPEAMEREMGRRLASPLNPFKWLSTRHGATLFAVATAALLAGMPAPGQSWSLATFGQGGLILWPLFGATNQLLGGLAFLVIGAWLIAMRRPWWFITAPALFMLVVPAWALVWQAFIGNEANASWLSQGRWILVAVGVATLALEAWLLVEVTLRARAANRPITT